MLTMNTQNLRRGKLDNKGCLSSELHLQIVVVWASRAGEANVSGLPPSQPKAWQNFSICGAVELKQIIQGFDLTRESVPPQLNLNRCPMG